ncbi:hypothetical protein HDA32_004276 [Spinactinospora alkalitolerans]|uniref:Uncharacterized protein n=1 Tax=Spinactinospora alkalitolerans TaxID=687207 RepID=A0A852TXC1_9ACTN|nr:hypothetical protein [Spinactinospora alkalitolerans]NYE49156.1 hypothetical protein [Spinactinospora alkalitolerans]
MTGETAQLLPATAAALGQLALGGVDRAGEGRVCVLIQVVGHALLPFTDGPLIGLDAILRWLDSWEVPRCWPAGPPATVPASYAQTGNERLWARGGHFGHSQVPESRAGGPGGIDPERILGSAAPRQRPGPPQSDAAPLPQVRHSRNGLRPHATAAP